jgi:hypothetical protein
MTTRAYSSPEAFKQALEQRLRGTVKTGADFARRRQLLVFDRYLARIVSVLGDAATLKGASSSSFGSSAPVRRRTSICGSSVPRKACSRSSRKQHDAT